MALNVQFTKVFNRLIEQYIVTPRLVNQQTLEYNKLCDYLADGSTVTATDVSAVMKQVEKKLPFLLGLNVKVICSPEGLTFRPTISGSITQSQLKAKLEARKEAETDPEKAAKIDVNRELETSDLTTNDIVASIVIDLPKKWLERFHAEAEFKRVTSGGQQSDDGQQGDGSSGSSGSSGSNDSSGQESVATPTISGTTPFSDSTQMTISGPTGATIHYTTDGSTPTSSSTQYSSAVTLSDTTTVKAIAIKDGVSSSIATKTFTKSDGTGGDDGGDGVE